MKIVDLIAFIPLCLFLISPLIQIVREIITPHRVSVFFGPIFTYPGTIEIIHLIAAVVAAILWILLVSKWVKQLRSGKRPELFLPLVLFVTLSVWMYISQSVNGFTEYAYTGEPYRNESLFFYMLYLLAYFLFGTVVKTERLRKFAVMAFLGSNLAVGILVLIDYYVTRLSFFQDSEGVAAVFHQFNHYGYYLVFGILLSAMLFVAAEEKTWVRVTCAVIYLVDVYILILNNTFGCYLAVVAALVFGTIVLVVSRRNRNEIIRMIAVFLTLVLVTLGMRVFGISNSQDVSKLVKDVGDIASDNENASSAGTGRWALWTHTVEYIKEKPVFGWGVEGMTEKLGDEEDTINNRPHNEYLQWAAFFGIPAALLYLAALCVIMFGMFPFLKHLESVSLACFIASAGYIVSSLFGNTMYYTTPFFFIFLGMTYCSRFYQRQSEGADKEETGRESVA